MKIIYWIGYFNFMRWFRKLYYKKTRYYKWGIINIINDDKPTLDWGTKIDEKWWDQFLV